MTTGTDGPRDNLVAALPWSIVGTFMLTLMFALPKFAESSADPMQAAWFRYLGGAAVMLIVFSARAATASRPRSVGRDPAFADVWYTYLPWHMLRAALGAGTVSCSIYAVTQIPIATAMSIVQTNGAFVLLFAALFLKERISTLTAGAGALALIGGLVVAEPNLNDLSAFLTPGAAIGFLGAIFWGGEVTLLKYTADRDQPLAILLMVNVSACLILLLPALWLWREVPLEFLVIYAAMGPIAIVGQFCNIRAFKLATASSLTPLKYAGMVFAGLFGILFFGEIPGWPLLIGGAMIVAGGWIATRAANIPRRIA